MYREAATGWTTAATQYLGFDVNVQAIIAHRKANPRFNLSTDYDSVAWELEQQTVKRLQGIRGAQQFIVGDPGALEIDIPKRVPPQRKSAAAVGVEKVKAGTSLIVEWLGDGLQPVPIELAHRRASVCVKCPHNQKPGLIGKVLAAAARSVHLLIEAREEMKLSTPDDVGLHQCGICKCDLKLKVFAPLNHVLSGTTDDEMRQFPPVCWVKSESLTAPKKSD